MANFRDAVIVSAARTPTGKFQGLLKGMTAPELGAIAIRAAVERAGVDPAKVDEVIMGCVVQAGIGQAPARQAALKAGLAAGSFGFDDKYGVRFGTAGGRAREPGGAAWRCGIRRCGRHGIDVEYSIRSAHGTRRMRMGNQTAVDLMIHDGLWCPFENWHMGNTGEVVAEKYQITREEQDDYAFNSHRKADEAQRPRVVLRTRSFPSRSRRRRATRSCLITTSRSGRKRPLNLSVKLRPAFKKDGGTVTAGNAPGVNDGASALVVTSVENAAALGVEPLGRVVASATSGIEPKLIMMAPVEGRSERARKSRLVDGRRRSV